MIELFDANRLLPRRDHSLPLLGLALAAAMGGVAVYAGALQQHLRQEQANVTRLGNAVRQAQALGSKAPSAALLADLQRQVALAEAENAAVSQGTPAGAQAALSPSSWLDRLAALGSAEVSLTKVEVDARGSTRIEGLAVNAQAVSSFVQAFSRQEALAGLAPRSVELRHDKTTAPHLHFQLQATAPGAASAKAAPAAATTPAVASPKHVATPAATPAATPTGTPTSTPTAAATPASATRS